MKKLLLISFLLTATMSHAGYYLKGQKPESTTPKPKVVGDSGFSFKGESTPKKEKVQKKSSGFIHPLDFKGTEEEKQQVVSYIKARTKKEMEMTGLDSNSIARAMEQEQLESFKVLTEAKDRKILDSVISQLKMIDMINYSTMKAMYDDELEASQEELTW